MTFDARKYAREWRRRERAKKLAIARQTRHHCPQKAGRFGVCGARLEDVVLPGGFVKLSCPRCARREAGICRDCPGPVSGTVRKAWYCAKCRERRIRLANKLYRDRHRDVLRKRWAAQQRQYRAIDPTTSRRCARQWRINNRERRNAYVRAYRQRKRDEARAMRKAA